MSNKYCVIGIMSGTSLDGLDIAFCEFELRNGSWIFRIPFAETVSYSAQWKKRLGGLTSAAAAELAQANSDLGIYIGSCITSFMQKHQILPDFISSHGHTVFHQPENGLTLQIGSGAAIAAMTHLDVVCDFRSKDVALGGQGAPLVPAGDVKLFSEYRCCLNLGGIANISISHEGAIKAFDICPANMPLNDLINEKGMAFDDGGMIARSGKVDHDLLEKLNQLHYYSCAAPKSIGREWYENEFAPLLNKNIPVEDKLATVCQHIGIQVAASLKEYKVSAGDTILLTGGGAYNLAVTEAIRTNCNSEIIIPDKNIIEFKEALIFAFLGVLYVRKEPNVLASVTGSKQDHIGGAMYNGK